VHQIEQTPNIRLRPRMVIARVEVDGHVERVTGRELMAAVAYPRVWKESREPLPLETSVPACLRPATCGPAR
jgi:hypothetical protein